jgi:hypothetical protein
MAAATSGLAEMQLSAISVYMAFLAAWIETLAGDDAAAERLLREARTHVEDPDDHWYLSMLDADLVHALLAQDRVADAVATLAELDARPIPCDAEWVIRRHIARALVAARSGDPERGMDHARAGVAVADRTGFMVFRADAHSTHGELLAATGDMKAAARALSRALALHEAKGNALGAAATRAQLARLLAGAAAR